jgi:transcriptional regulator with XRE-family HTH domain
MGEKIMQVNGKQILKERIKLGLTLRDMATLTEVSKSTLSRIETGNENVHISTVSKIAKALNKEVEYFIVE